MEIKRFDVFLVNLHHQGANAPQMNSPSLVISPNEMNRHISTVIVAPMTTKGKKYPTRIVCSFQGKKGQIVLDQIRTIDRKRLVKKSGIISKKTQAKTLTLLQELFAP